MQITKRLTDLEAGIKEKQRIGAEKVKFIEVIMPDYIEIYDLEAGTNSRVYKHDEQTEQAN